METIEEFMERDPAGFLKRHDAHVVYDDVWCLSWKHGVVDLDVDKNKSYSCAAMFVYLYLKGVEVSVATNLSRLYSKEH